MHTIKGCMEKKLHLLANSAFSRLRSVVNMQRLGIVAFAGWGVQERRGEQQPWRIDQSGFVNDVVVNFSVVKNGKRRRNTVQHVPLMREQVLLGLVGVLSLRSSVDFVIKSFNHGPRVGNIALQSVAPSGTRQHSWLARTAGNLLSRIILRPMLDSVHGHVFLPVCEERNLLAGMAVVIRKLTATCSFILVISLELIVVVTSQSIAMSWSKNLNAVCAVAKKFIIRMESETIIGLKILSFGLGRSQVVSGLRIW